MPLFRDGNIFAAGLKQHCRTYAVLKWKKYKEALCVKNNNANKRKSHGQIQR